MSKTPKYSLHYDAPGDRAYGQRNTEYLAHSTETALATLEARWQESEKKLRRLITVIENKYKFALAQHLIDNGNGTGVITMDGLFDNGDGTMTVTRTEEELDALIETSDNWA